MNSRAVSRLAWVLWAVMALLFLLTIVFSLSRPPTIPELTANNAVWSLLFMVFATVGALIVSRRPDSAVGWIFLLTSVLHLFPSFAYDYATLGTSGSWLDIEIVAWLSVVTFPSLFALVLVFLPLLFPNSRPPSPRWNLVAWFTIGVVTLTTIAAALYPGPMEVQPQVSNPFGIEGAEGFLKPILDLFFPLMGIASVLASASVVLRFRRAKGEERLQLKWFAYAVALLATYFAIDVVVEGPLGGNIGAVSQAIAFTLVFAIPISVGVAILKYRLYDIDLLINRTLVYVPLTAIIAGTYIAAITLFRSLFVGLTGQNSDAAIVLTTLVVAAAFTPVKNWLQTVVDRRFKEVSDPTKNLSAFREQLRSVVQVLKAEQVAQRFLHEAASAFGAECGAVYLSQNGQEERVYMYGSVTVENALTIPIEYEGSRLGSIVLGPRRNGLAYTAQDGEALRKTAKIVAEAVSLTRVDARHLPLDPAAITR